MSRVSFQYITPVIVFLWGSPVVAQVAPGFEEPPAASPPREQVEETSTDLIETILPNTATTISRIVTSRVSGLRRGVGGALTDPDDTLALRNPRARQYASRTVAQADQPPEAPSPWSGWGTPSITLLDSDDPALRFDGMVATPLAGVDYLTDTGWLFGVAAGYERVDLDTQFAGRSGTLGADGVSVVPYFGGRLGDRVLLDGGIGYTRVWYERTDRGAGDDTFNGDRYLAFTNVTGFAPGSWLGDSWQLSATAGMSFAYEDQSDLDTGDQSQRLGQVKIGPKLTYGFTTETGPGQLFVDAKFNYDVIRDDAEGVGGFSGTGRPSDDRSDVVLATGFEAALGANLSMNGEISVTLGREDFASQTFSFGLRYQF